MWGRDAVAALGVIEFAGFKCTILLQPSWACCTLQYGKHTYCNMAKYVLQYGIYRLPCCTHICNMAHTYCKEASRRPDPAKACRKQHRYCSNHPECVGMTYSVLRLVMPFQELGTEPSRELLNRVLHSHTIHESKPD